MHQRRFIVQRDALGYFRWKARVCDPKDRRYPSDRVQLYDGVELVGDYQRAIA